MTPQEIIDCAKRVFLTETEGLKLLQNSLGDAFVQAVQMMFQTQDPEHSSIPVKRILCLASNLVFKSHIASLVAIRVYKRPVRYDAPGNLSRMYFLVASF